MAARRRRRKRSFAGFNPRHRRRRTYRRHRARRNPYTLNARAPRRHRRRRSRRNPIVPTGLLQRGLAVAAGFLAAPRLTNLIPWEFPGGKLGAYVKEFLVIAVGSQVAKRALGAKYGNALFAGGVIHIAVDMLQTYVPSFGGSSSGVGYYFPPDDQLALSYGAGAGALAPDTFVSGDVARLSSRFS